MRFNKYFSRALSGALGLTVLVSGVGVASYSAGAESAAPATTAEKQPQDKSEAAIKNAANALEKTETVYVIAKADGTPEKVIVSDWIKNTGKADKITDKSNLTDIENVKGDEGYTIDEKKMVQWDAKGNDKKTAVITALETSIPSIIVSAMGLFAATVGVAIYSEVDMISSLCALMARGAIISMFCVVLFLPAMFMLFDKVIGVTTLGFRKKK